MSTEKEKTPKKAKKEKTLHEIRKEEKVTTSIYVGPSIPGGALQQNAVFTSDLPVFAKEETEKCPFIKELIVPINELSLATSNLSVKGTKENIMYNKVIEFYKGASN